MEKEQVKELLNAEPGKLIQLKKKSDYWFAEFQFSEDCLVFPPLFWDICTVDFCNRGATFRIKDIDLNNYNQKT